MSKKKKLERINRARLIKKLSDKYTSSSHYHQWLYYRKKYSWLLVITFAKFIKRALDIVLAIGLLVFSSLLMLFTAICIKLSNGGPIFYISKRIGRWGKEFNFPKFRTMYLGAEKEKAILSHLKIYPETGTFKIENDPCITKLGWYLRKFSIDELPQLWCVIKGDMSLVGPRPPLPEEVAMYSPNERARLEVTPGLTCLWQISGRSNVPFSRQVLLDLEYIESQSFWLDVKILLKTIPSVILGKGAY